MILHENRARNRERVFIMKKETNEFTFEDNGQLLHDMEKEMGRIYEELRKLFFSHGHEMLPLFESFNAPRIKLSESIKTKVLGKKPLEEVIAKIKPLMDQIRTADRLKDAVSTIEQIINNCECGEIKNKSDFAESLKELCDTLDKTRADGKDVFNNEGDKKIIEAIDFLKIAEIKVPVLGEFSAKRNLITLYTEANRQCSSSNIFINRMLTTLAHELFHAMHCSVAGKDKWAEKEDEKKDEKKSTVIESLARWAEYCWCKHQIPVEFNKIAENLKRGWVISDFPSDPYSGAKVFDNKAVLDLDFEVLDASIKKGWDEAYAMMESHRNDIFLDDDIDDERGLLSFLYNDFKGLLHNADSKEWAVIHPHNFEISENDNLALCELVQRELEQRGLAVKRILCKGRYLKRNYDYVKGISALLFIKKGVFEKEKFIDSVQAVAAKHVNTFFPYFALISTKSGDTNKALFIRGNDGGSIKTEEEEYEDFNECLTLATYQEFFKRIGVIMPHSKI